MTQYSQFTAEENERLRRLLRDHIESKGMSAAQAARAMGVSSNTVTVFLNRKNGAGTTLVRGLEKLLGMPLDLMLGRTNSAGVRLDALPGWPEAIASAQTFGQLAFPGEDVRPEDYAEVGAWIVPAPVPLEPAALAYMARAVAVRRRQAGGGSTPPPSNAPSAAPKSRS